MVGEKQVRRVFVCGVGMTKFEKPGKREDFDYPNIASEAGTKALGDAGIRYDDVQQAVVGYVYGDSTCGQRAVYELGMTGIPVYNVNNNCATGASALLLAKQIVEAGADCVMALGFEKMQKGSLSAMFSDRTVPLDKHLIAMEELSGFENAPVAAQIFGNAGREYMEKYGTDKEVFGKIAVKNHKHSVDNEVSQFRDEYTLEEVMKSQSVFEPLTKLQCCPTSDGGAAAILCSEEFVKERGLQNRAVEILALEMATDLPSTFQDKSCMKIAGFDMTKKASSNAFRKAGLRPNDVDVVELHDCFSVNELITYEALGLAEEGKGAGLVEKNDNTFGGKYVINPSGGLISKGHPLGATGIAQCVEICKQLRGEAGKRQVRNARIGLQHNIGLGGAAVVGLYHLFVPETRVPAPRLQLVKVAQTHDPKLKSAAVFELMADGLKEKGGELVKKMKAVFCFDLSGGPDGKSEKWYLDLKNGNGCVTNDGTGLKPDVTFLMKDSDCFDLLTGKMNPQMGFMKGKIKLKGNMGVALKLRDVQKQISLDGLKSKL